MKLLFDVHCHTIASGHAYGTILEYVDEAAKTGLELIAITEHGPAMPNSTGAFYFTNFVAIPEVINGIKVLMGIELNILNSSGEVDLDEELLQLVSPVIASLHPPCYKFSSENMKDGERFSEVTETLLNIMQNKYIHIIGHPGDLRYPFDIEKVVRSSVETGTLLEINNSNLLASTYRKGSRAPMIEILKECKRQDCPVVFGSDAHFPTLLGKFKENIDLIKEADFPEELVINSDTEQFLKLLRH